jgi:hypothetical protein
VYGDLDDNILLLAVDKNIASSFKNVNVEYPQNGPMQKEFDGFGILEEYVLSREIQSAMGLATGKTERPSTWTEANETRSCTEVPPRQRRRQEGGASAAYLGGCAKSLSGLIRAQPGMAVPPKQKRKSRAEAGTTCRTERKDMARLWEGRS